MGKDLKGKELGTGYTQRKDGRYEARAIINGVRVDVYNSSLKILKEIFEAEKAKVLREEKNYRPNVTLKEWFDEWFEKCKSPSLKSELTRDKYKRRLDKTLIRLLGEKKVEDISQINIQVAANILAGEEYSGRYIREAIGNLRDCLDSAVANHIILTNPCIDISISGIQTVKEVRVLDHWEQDLFIEEIKGSYYYEAYMILLLTGMRIGEFSGLQWEDVDFNKKEINIRRTLSTGYFKGKKVEILLPPKTQRGNRIIPFFDNAEELFKSWMKKQDEYKKQLGDRWRCKKELGNLVFTSTMGSPVSRYVIVHDLEHVIEDINLKEITRAHKECREPRKFEHIHPHTFRHTFATRCFENGFEPLFVQSIMGHSNYSTTVSYTHVLDNIKKREIAKTCNFLNANKS